MKRKGNVNKKEQDVSESEEEEQEYESEGEESDSEESEPEFIESELESEYSDELEDEAVNGETDSDLSESEFDEDTKLPVLTTALSDRLLNNSLSQSANSVRKLISVFSSVISSTASDQINLKPEPKGKKESKKESSTKMKFKYLKNENKRLLKGTVKRYYENTKESKKKYVVKDRDVYVSFVSRTFDFMSEYLEKRTVLSKKEEVLSVAPVVRRFLSGSIVQLAFALEDFDLTRSSLISLSSKEVVRWISVFKHINNQFVKIVSSLMCSHPQKLTRVNCFQFLLEYLKCTRNNQLMKVQLSARSYTANHAKLTDSQAKEVTNNNINFLLKRCYSSHVKSVMNGITAKNYALYKLTENCITELYLESPQDNLYVHSFKSIRDLAYNVRREWNEANKTNSKKKSGKKAKKSKQKETKESKEPKDKESAYLTVCSWGFIESVSIWVKILSRSSEKMKALVYPLVTVINSAIKIKIANKRQIPFVLHLLTCLNQLSEGINKFIPIGSLLFFLLENLKIFKPLKNPKAHLEKSDDIMTKLRLSSKELHSVQTRKVLYKHLELVLVDHLGLVSLNPSFPEFTVPVLHYLTNYVKSRTVLYEFKNKMGYLFKVIKESNEVVTAMRESLPSGSESNLMVFEGSKVPIWRHRQELISKHEELTREKFLSTLELGKLEK